MTNVRRQAREWTLRVLLVLVLGALAWSLTYEGSPPKDVVHTHHAFRLYALGEYVEFPLFNYKVRHVDVHVEPDTLAGDRGSEVVHVHRAGITLGDFVRSLGVSAEPGRICLDDESRVAWAIHHGECYEDNGTHQWRLYLAVGDGPMARVSGDPVDAPGHGFTAAERLLLTYVAKAAPDDDLALEAQRGALMPDMTRWPQFRADGA